MKLYLVTDNLVKSKEIEEILKNKGYEVFNKLSNKDGLLHLNDMLDCDAVIIISELAPHANFDCNIAQNNKKDVIIVNKKYYNAPSTIRIAKARFKNIEEVNI